MMAESISDAELADDWLERTRRCELDDFAPEELRRWLNASPRRAMAEDGSFFVVGRAYCRYENGGDYFNAPPESFQPIVSSNGVIGLIAYDGIAPVGSAWSRVVFPEGAKLLRADAEPKSVRLHFELDDALRAYLGLDVTHQLGDIAVSVDKERINAAVRGSSMYSPPCEYTAERRRDDFAAFLAACGLSSPRIDEIAARLQASIQSYEEVQRGAKKGARKPKKDSRAAALGGLKDGLRKRIDEAGLGVFETAICKLGFAAVNLLTVGDKAHEHRVGGSRIGGEPDLPEGFDWPNEDEEAYFTFIMQLNLGELPELPASPLPREGIISLFAGGIDDHNPTCCLFHFPEKGLARRPRLENVSWLNEMSQIEARDLVFAPVVSLPPYGSVPAEALVEGMTKDERDAYFGLVESLTEAPNRVGTLLGYLSCYVMDYLSEEHGGPGYERGIGLLELESVPSLDICWLASGCLSGYIERKELAEGNWDTSQWFVSSG